MKQNLKTLAEQREKNMKAIQDKLQLNQKEIKRFNPVSMVHFFEYFY